jgi:hypothetical protein
VTAIPHRHIVASPNSTPNNAQIEPSLAALEQNLSKKKAWISFDSLRRIEPFQGFAATAGKKILSLTFLVAGGAGLSGS